MSNAAEIGDFLDQIWQDTEGYVYLPVKGPERFHKFMIPWPAKREQVINHILKYAALPGHEVFFSPALYKARKPTAENVLGAWVAWADFDGNAPETWPKSVAPIPTIEIQSSIPGKKHVYWALSEFTSPKKVQEINRSLAYALSADLSGWDANQFLRPPFTMNRKYAKPIEVTILKNRLDRMYEAEDFAKVPAPREAIQASVELDALPDITEVLAEATWDSELLELFRTTGDEMQHESRDRSGALQRLAYEGAEHGWQDNQIMAVLLDADERWGKYVGRPSRNKILLDLINRARAKVGYRRESDLLDLAARFRNTPEVEDGSEDKRLYSVKELAHMEGIKDWLIEGLMIPQGIGHFTGRAGVGKTQLAMQLAADMASGRGTFLGFPLSGEPKRVLVVSLEMNEFQLPHMMKPLFERYPDLDEAMLKVFPLGDVLALETPVGQALLESVLDEMQPDLVIADSLSWMSAADITSDQDMKELFSYLQRARARHNFGMVIIHHHRKKANDAQSKKQPDTLHDVYGSYIVTSTVDFVLNLEERPEDLEEKRLTLTLLKNRYSAVPEPQKVMRGPNLHFSVLENLAEKLIGGAPDANAPSLSVGLA